ncbi:FecR domain-containing protein [uncultured Draconibacterium sp.]|uniref:FecR family protein n=1 Tax=uncultured Draconibacterium sp. TaxID=1573823 RepID=UPI00321653FC
MKENIQNKWEEWASNLHGESDAADTNLSSDEASDKKAVESIFELRGNVSKARRLKAEDKAWAELKKQLVPQRFWQEFLKYAAIVVVSLLVGGSAFWTYTTFNEPVPVFASITAPNGQISNVTLFDGTNIWLNAGSTLKYTQNFNTATREVFLEGEAYFDVTKDKERPFVVNAGKSQIKVLGTVFNVKAYQNEPKVETVLVEGKIEFSAGGKSILVDPGEHILYTENSNRIVKKEVNTADYTAWKGGKIYFNNESLLELTLQLERWYEVKFQFTGEHIKKYRFTGVINTDKTLDYTLKIIEAINKVDFEFNNEQIKIVDKK